MLNYEYNKCPSIPRKADIKFAINGFPDEAIQGKDVCGVCISPIKISKVPIAEVLPFKHHFGVKVYYISTFGHPLSI